MIKFFFESCNGYLDALREAGAVEDLIPFQQAQPLPRLSHSLSAVTTPILVYVDMSTYILCPSSGSTETRPLDPSYLNIP